MSVITDAYAWQIGEVDRTAAVNLAAALELPPLMAQLLLQRGIPNPEAAHAFLNPSLRQVSDPFQLTDMAVAVERIAQARKQGERVLVFGDYDADGITGTALLVNALRRYGLAHVEYALPQRLEEGYGIQPSHVMSAKERGIGLIITVDNGIAAIDAAEAANSAGVDLIITDHHKLTQETPHAYAVVNPQRESADHPAREISGAAVAFKLAWALTGKALDLDLAAIGVVADIVPLRGENRALVALGLKEITDNPRLGIAKLASVAGLRKGRRTAEQIAFQIAPRINAGGRLGDGMAGLELLLTESPQEAQRLAKELDAANNDRRSIEQAIFDEIQEELRECFHPNQRTIVMARRDWHPGVIGIVASRVQRKYFRPVVLVALGDDGAGRGSARSIADFDIANALKRCEEHLVKYGGHHQAAGMTIEEHRLDAFRESFERTAAERLGNEHLIPALKIDAVASFSQIDGALLEHLARLEPHGAGNPAPVFSTFGVETAPNSPRELRNGHMKAAFRQDGRLIPAIGFGMAHHLPLLSSGAPTDIAYAPRFDEWNGERTIQLMLKDIRPAGS